MRNTQSKHITACIVSAVWLFLCSGICLAGPAIREDFILVQPDGTTFTARLRGDEFMKILTTADGCSIIQGEDGWYCYAYYESDGTKTRTDFKAGKEAPSDVKARSRNIPYALLQSSAARYRKEASGRQPGKSSVLRRTMEARGLDTKSGNAPEEKHGIVILAQFADLAFKAEHTSDAFRRLLTEPGYSVNGADGSAIDYFNDQFQGIFTFSFDVSEIVTLSKNYAEYGANASDGSDIAAADMVAEACRLADSQVDFSKYDDDGDGEVDNVFVFFAGGDEAEGAGDDHIWSHAWYLTEGAGIPKDEVTFDGVIVSRYACTAELSRVSGTKNQYTMAHIGTFCHEFSHTLGLADLYDTDYEKSGGESKALWQILSLMDAGNFNNNGRTPPNFTAVDRDQTDVFEAIPLTVGTHVLEPIDRNGQYYKMETGTEGEYYLFECRAAEGWDEYIGGSGLLIYHIDKSSRDAGYSESYKKNVTAEERWLYNEVNANPVHECADLIEAYQAAKDVSQVFFPYRTGNTDASSFTPVSEPAFVFWDGTSSPLAITGIERDGENIRMTVSEFTGELPKPEVVSSDVFQDAAIISWTSGAGYTGDAVFRWKKSDDAEFQNVTVQPYSMNRYACSIDGLTPGTPYKCEIQFEGDGTQSKVTECNFTTGRDRGRQCPFIVLRYVAKNSDGTYPEGTKFPLRLHNATDAEAVEWYMDDEQIFVDESCYYTPSGSGEMRAEIHYSDGSKSIVTKTINIKPEQEKASY